MPEIEAYYQARRACADHPDASVLVLVTGQCLPVGDLARLRGVVPVSMMALAVRCGQEPFRRRRVGAMDVLDLDRLEDLPRAMRRLV